MSWNYRVIRNLNGKDPPKEELYFFSIHSVYYSDGVPSSWSKDPYIPCGETIDILSKDLLMMSEALNKPPLEVYVENGVYKIREITTGKD